MQITIGCKSIFEWFLCVGISVRLVCVSVRTVNTFAKNVWLLFCFGAYISSAVLVKCFGIVLLQFAKGIGAYEIYATKMCMCKMMALLNACSLVDEHCTWRIASEEHEWDEINSLFLDFVLRESEPAIFCIHHSFSLTITRTTQPPTQTQTHTQPSLNFQPQP